MARLARRQLDKQAGRADRQIGVQVFRLVSRFKGWQVSWQAGRQVDKPVGWKVPRQADILTGC